MTIKEKRKYVTDYICKMYDDLDPSGTNTKMFMDEWGKLSDQEFARKFEKYINNPKLVGFYLEIVEFERDLTLENVMKCAKDLDIPLFEYVALPHINGSATENVVVTPEPVPVGMIHEKRMQQTALKKNTGSIHIEERNPKTGLVSGDDKNATNSNVETYSMVATGAKYALKEFMGPRADNGTAKNEMYASINRDGFVSLEELSNNQKDKTAINSLDVYFTMQGLRTNLVYPAEVIPSAEAAKMS